MSGKSQAEINLSIYQAEMRRMRQRTAVGYFVLILCAAILYMVSAGDRYNHILRYVGLQGIGNEKSGVFADCSKAANKDSPYCEPKTGAKQKTWQSLQRSGGSNNPFSLYKPGE